MAPDSFPSGTVTFLFTDLEGSTRLWQEHPDEMGTALVRHDEILRAAVAAHHGHTVKTTGDGIHAAFGAAHDAINAAVRAQHAITDEDWGVLGPLRIRIGVHTGPAEARDGDYFGTAVNRAARLMSTAHGGQVVCSQATAELLHDDFHSVELIDLGEHRLRDLARPVRVYQISDAGLPQNFPTLRSLDNAPTNLPVQPTSLVGRGKLITDLAALLDRDPVVTLTGVGGVGKTRLALEVGAETLPMFADGVWVVDLAPIAHDEMVLATIVEVLGISAQTGEPLATTITSRLRSKHLLLILDNCEHLLTPVARFVDRLVGRSPRVRVLATSREPLGIAAERVRAVPPLAEDTEAVDLFVERAAHVDATFDSSEQRHAIREICVRLDGIPLAIELAAARTRMMAPTQIAERLNQRFRLLTGGGRTAVERHRTLQATVAWSYELLDELERSVFQRLSTLAGSFDLPAAEAIAAGDPVEDFEVLDAVGHLVDKSMVITVGAAEGVRYRMLETLRQFAAERLAEQPNPIEVHDRHARYWRDRAVTLGRASGGTDYATVLDTIDIDLDNYRTAFAHLLATGQINDAVSGILALYGYWQIRRPREGLQWNQRLLNHSELDPRNRHRALAFVAQLMAHVGDMRTAENVAIDAINFAEADGTDPQWGTLMALLMIGSQTTKDPVNYQRWYEVGLRVAGTDRYRRLITEGMRGGVCPDDELDEMLGHYERLHVEVERHGDPVLRVATGITHAMVLRRVGQVDKGRTLVRAACDPRAGPTAYAGALCQAAAFEVLTDGDIEHARLLAAEAAAIARDQGLTSYAITSAYITAAIAAQQHNFDAASTLIIAADAHAERLGVGESSSLECRQLAQQLIATFGEVADGNHPRQAMTVDDLIDYTLEALQ